MVKLTNNNRYNANDKDGAQKDLQKAMGFYFFLSLVRLKTFEMIFIPGKIQFTEQTKENDF